jgi:hypothetical protein
MVQAGLATSIIVNKIRTSKTNFNTSTDELIRLWADSRQTTQSTPCSIRTPPLHPTQRSAGERLSKGNWRLPEEGQSVAEIQPEVADWKMGGVGCTLLRSEGEAGH